MLRWPEELRGTGAGFEGGEDVPFEPCDSDAAYEWQFDVEPGYLYAILVFWGEGYFVEYPFRTESIYQ